MNEDSQENKREFIRLELSIPLYADLSLWSIDEREMRSRTQRVVLGNISMGGCQFKTYLQIPPRQDVKWLLRVQLGKYEAQLKAVIVRTAQEDGLQTYGACWAMTGLERQSFQYRLNEYLYTVLLPSPHILTLYKKIAERENDGQFRQLDVSS